MGCAERRTPFVLAALLALVVAVYFPARQAGFYSDDDLYVTRNPLVSAGLSAGAAARAFVEPVAGNWHPLTVLSLALDAELFGPGPRGFHLANVLYHGLAVCAAFLVLSRITGALWPSAAVAAVFAAHPLHVESVAWISGRKDVLSGLLFWLAVGAYHRYAQRPSPGRWALVAALFALGLMSKPTLVVLPLLLLLLDFWPLGRVRDGWHANRGLVLEKLPWLALAAVVSAAAVVTQSRSGALQTLDNLPLDWRLRNAGVSVAAYLRETFWPSGLIPLHPFPHTPPPWGSALPALLLLAAITAAALLVRNRRPAVPVGWAWFALTLLPVAGFVQVGGQRMADRYMYLPLAGLSMALAWGAADRAGRWRDRLVPAVAVLAVAALAAAANLQARVWESGETIYRQALAVGREDEKWLAHYGLGYLRYEAGDTRGAAAQFAETVKRRPDYAPAYHGLATVQLREGNPTGALAYYRMALLEAPKDAGSRQGEGLALAALGRHEEAVAAFREALASQPDFAEAARDLGASLEALGRPSEAIAAYGRALALHPGLAGAREGLDRLLAARRHPAPTGR